MLAEELVIGLELAGFEPYLDRHQESRRDWVGLQFVILRTWLA